MGYPWLGPQTGGPGGAQKLSKILSRLGELLNTQKNVHFFAPRGAPRGSQKGTQGGTPLDPPK